MALNPDEIASKQFTIGLRGFDRDEVEDYLGKVARQMRRLDDELSEAETNVASAVADAAAARELQANLEVPAALAPMADSEPARKTPATLEEDLEYFTDDRFTEFGDRMAALLRLAHEDAAEVRAQAEADAVEAREVSDAATLAANEAAASVRAEADEYRSEVRAEAEAYRQEVKAEAEAYREEVKAEVHSERDLAGQELQAARDESAELLSQARSHAEFIQHEADEMSRAKIRDNMQAAEKRLSILRTTEVSSRERILIAQNELQAALAKLEESPLQELTDPSVADGILEEANVKADAIPAIATPEAEAETVEVDSIEAEIVEVDSIEVDESSELADADIIDVVETEEEIIVEEAVVADEVDVLDETDLEDEVDVAEHSTPEDAAEEELVTTDELASEDQSEGDEIDASSHLGSEIDLPEIPGVDSVIESGPESAEVEADLEVEAEETAEVADADDTNGAGSGTNAPWWAKKRKNTDAAIPPPPPPPTGAVSVVNAVPAPPIAPGDSPLSGVAEAARAAAQEMNAPEVETPDNEDALARLVREAMQKAVEGARGPES